MIARPCRVPRLTEAVQTSTLGRHNRPVQWTAVIRPAFGPLRCAAGHVAMPQNVVAMWL
jgi:hypothetical protein